MSHPPPHTEPRANPTPDKEKGGAGNPSIPCHWQCDTYQRDSFFPHRLAFWVFRLLCLIAFGSGDLKKLWNSCYPNPQDEGGKEEKKRARKNQDKRDRAWEREATRVKERLEHLNLVSSLLLASMVVLCTTQPPVYGADMVKIVPYGDPSPYIIMATSVTFALGALIVGSGAVFIIHCAKPDWFREKMMGSRFRLWATLVMLSLPCISLAFSIGSAVIGLLAATTLSSLLYVRVWFYLLAAPPVASWYIFLAMLY